ncbi:MAG TPA: adenylate/guanylate cyclase domain-containing protein [Mycobacteriales bacterium]|nr:adenylate/guanylate cyclase domain-containing protein [Mycobacteriales bacterium]
MTAAAWKPFTDEPVRGVILPAWLFSLPGIERVQMVSRGLVARPPSMRLFGVRIGHVGAGTATVTMPASANFVSPPAMDVHTLFHDALWTAATTTVPAGFDVAPVTMSVQYFRNPRPQPGNFLARARVLNSSSVFVCASVQVEDPSGREVGHGVAQFAVRALDPPAPAAPASVEPLDEPTYSTPDPPDRPPVGVGISADLSAHSTGLEIARMFASGELPPVPVHRLIGLYGLEVRDDGIHLRMTASEWLCRSSHHISESALHVLHGGASMFLALTVMDRGQSAAVLDVTSRFRRPVPADGRELTARSRLRHSEGSFQFVESEVFDADGSVVSTGSSVWAIINQRARRAAEPERVLATLLFTDIVGSTGRAQQMGDVAWRGLLGEHHALVRRELVAHHGREIKTIGDGFLARFDSPAAALRCAMAIRDGVRQLDLEIRAGVHTGECEVQGNDLVGIALHVAARIVTLAGVGEVLVSHLVKDLAAGSGLRFTPRGSHPLKGIDGEWMLFSVGP